MAGRLAAVPEESTDGSAAPYPPRGLYRDWIRTVAVSGAQRRSTIFSHSQSGYSGSSYSSASNSYPSNNSGCSSGSASAVALHLFCAQELTMIARQMVSDGYTQRVVLAFDVASPAPTLGNGGGGGVLETWFCELDVGWVLQIRQEHGSSPQLWLQGKSASMLQELVERWIRGLTVIIVAIAELVSTYHEMAAVARFGKASISKMLVFLDAIVPAAFKAEKLQAVLDMYICVSNATYMFTPVVVSTEAQSIFHETGGLLSSARNRLNEAISSTTMEEVRILVDEGDGGLWAIETKHGGGEVDNNTRLVVNSIVSMKKAMALTRDSAQSHSTENLGGLINGTMDYLKDLLLRKSESCSDPSLRYLFLLNNSYFVAQVVPEPSVSLLNPDELWPGHHQTLELTPECKKYMDSYLDASWGHVLSCIPKSRSGRWYVWINASSVAKFESAFHKTYQAQKFWKVPDPRLRDALRRAIAERVISGYHLYPDEHPELEQHIGRKISSPEVFKDMLGQLFEG
ncbi:hypothetical protein ACQJBY_040219 [Aegilops geniculata]